MRIAYIISAYKLPEQLVRLVQKLYKDGTSFLIHVDKKTDEGTYAKMTGPLRAYAHVHFLDRHVCYWGDFGHVRATLKGIQRILRHDIPCDYVILLTGQDYPIKSNQHIHEVLEESQGQSFIHYFSLPCVRWSGNGGLDRIAYWHVNWHGRYFVFPQPDQFTLQLHKLFSGTH